MLVILGNQPKKKVKPKRIKGVLPPAIAERDFKKRLDSLWRNVLLPATERIKFMVKAKVPAAQIASYVEDILEQARVQYDLEAGQFLDGWKMSVARGTRQSMMDGLIRSLSVDISALVDDERIDEILRMGSMEAATLIKTIPEQYLGQVARAVYDNYTGAPQPEGRTLLQQMQQLQKGTKRRAELLARDQTKKLTSALTQARQESIGVTEYIWRTSKDERVVGNPSGLYPKGGKMHGDHFHRNGKKFKWSEPPADGPPGHAINCRCYAEPIIDLDMLLDAAK